MKADEKPLLHYALFYYESSVGVPALLLSSIGVYDYNKFNVAKAEFVIPPLHIEKSIYVVYLKYQCNGKLPTKVYLVNMGLLTGLRIRLFKSFDLII